jgi:hypothetical protein
VGCCIADGRPASRSQPGRERRAGPHVGRRTYSFQHLLCRLQSCRISRYGACRHKNMDCKPFIFLSVPPFFMGGKITPGKGQIVTFTVQSAPPSTICDMSMGGECRLTNATVDPIWFSGTDVGAQLNAADAALSNGGIIDARLLSGTISTSIALNNHVILLLGNGLYSGSVNPLIAISAGAEVTVPGIARGATELRYTGSGDADIIRCGSSSATGISCAYAKVEDVVWRPMEGSASTIGFHAYNPLFVSLINIWSTHSTCTGGLSDPTPRQGSCGTGSSLGYSNNIGTKFEMTSASNTVPPAGDIRVSGWIDATGRGNDSTSGTSRGIWFAGRPGVNQSLVNNVLDGAGDSESTNIPLELDYAVNTTVGGGWLFSGSTSFKSVGSQSVQLIETRFTNATVEHWNIDSNSYDVVLNGVTVSTPNTLGTDKGKRTITMVQCCAGSSWNLEGVSLAAATLQVGTIFTVATLPPCNPTNEGKQSGVKDAIAPAALSTVKGGGAVHVGVDCNGSPGLCNKPHRHA